MSGSLGDMGNLLAQAQKMQRAMAEAKEALEAEQVQGVTGGGAVSVTLTGSGQLLSVSISPEAYGGGRDGLEELVLLAMQDGLAKSNKLREKRMGEVTGGLNLPGLM